MSVFVNDRKCLLKPFQFKEKRIVLVGFAVLKCFTLVIGLLC